MSFFWLLSLATTSLGSACLVFFALPFGTKILKSFAGFLHKAWIPILALTGVYCLLIVQEGTSYRLARAKKDSPKGDNIQYEAASMIKHQRNIYIVLLGLTVLIGLLLLVWQVHSWANRNDAVRRRIENEIQSNK